MWAKRVERLADSGLTLKEFAAEIGVNANTLAGWRWRIQTRKCEEVSRQPSTPRFLEIVAAPGDERPPEDGEQRAPEVAAEPFELLLGGGHRIRVPVRFDPAALRRLVDALEAR